MKKPSNAETREDFFKAWQWLENNHVWAIIQLDIEVVKVAPKTYAVDDDKSKNTPIDFWLETGPLDEEDWPTHDTRLDCGAPTFEKAIIKLSKLVKKYYEKT